MAIARIQKLPSIVANQIAAGEVIERPASVVKELLENALDAGASAITIEISFGGLNQIKISDNGYGILAEDLPLAIAAHATSKITQLNDLYAIRSMGFRGEALASIAAISKLSISSKPLAQEHAMMLSVQGIAAPVISPCARAEGTTIEVRDLFFNAPVRKKFLKTPRTEYQFIEMLVKRFALSAPHLAITLKHDGKTIFTLPPAICEQTKTLRIKKLVGKAFIENSIYLDVAQAGLRLEGWISTAAYQRSQNDRQWVYINQRMVKDKLLHHAIKQAYENILDIGRYPACVLYLSISPAEVDVNVHPTKHEVRFQQPRLVHDFIGSQLNMALKQFKPALPKATRLPMTALSSLDIREEFIKKPLQAISTKDFSLPHHIILNSDFGVVFIQDLPYLINLNSVYKQWLNDKLAQEKLPFLSRPLLVPVRYELANQWSESLQSILVQLGIQLDFMGEKEIMVRSVPVLLPQLDIKIFLQGLERLTPRGLTAGSIDGQRSLDPAVKSRDVGYKLDHYDFKMADLQEHLVMSAVFDARQLTSEEKIDLFTYIQQHITRPNWLSVRLDIEKCRELMGTAEHV
jgi:DNA mismatch repair protein MutL